MLRQTYSNLYKYEFYELWILLRSEWHKMHLVQSPPLNTQLGATTSSHCTVHILNSTSLILVQCSVGQSLKLKGSVTRNFWLQVFFMKSVSPGPLSIPLEPFFRIIPKIHGDFGKWMFITGVNDTCDKLFPVSTTLAINPCHGFSVTAGVVNTNKKLAPRLLWPGCLWIHLFMAVSMTPSAATSDPGGWRYWCLLTTASVRSFAERRDLYCHNSLWPVSLIPVRNNQKALIYRRCKWQYQKTVHWCQISPRILKKL